MDLYQHAWASVWPMEPSRKKVKKKLDRKHSIYINQECRGRRVRCTLFWDKNILSPNFFSGKMMKHLSLQKALKYCQTKLLKKNERKQEELHDGNLS